MQLMKHPNIKLITKKFKELGVEDEGIRDVEKLYHLSVGDVYETESFELINAFYYSLGNGDADLIDSNWSAIQNKIKSIETYSRGSNLNTYLVDTMKSFVKEGRVKRKLQVLLKNSENIDLDALLSQFLRAHKMVSELSNTVESLYADLYSGTSLKQPELSIAKRKRKA